MKKLEFKQSDFRDFQFKHHPNNKSRCRMVVAVDDAVRAAQERFDSWQREYIRELKEQLAKNDAGTPGKLDSVFN